MVPELIPSILLQDEASVHERIDSIKDLVDCIQLDILDNTLYANTTWADPNVIKTWDLPCELELDLMVADPLRYIEKWKGVPALKRVIWHVEASVDHLALIKVVRGLGKEVGLSIAPETDVKALEPYLTLVDRILILGVKVGFSGQTMIPHTLETVRSLVTKSPHPVIAFDGGISDETIDALLDSGVEAICPNSWIFKHPPMQERIEAIRAKLKERS